MRHATCDIGNISTGKRPQRPVPRNGWLPGGEALEKRIERLVSAATAICPLAAMCLCRLLAM